ncbi:MAG: glycosyltransferase family 2 protein [Eubacteriales bacterium]|nr:glycosyltransferase family 2 protein [Eubacteriales bacterium]
MRALQMINFIIAILFFVCYSYQFVYIPVVLLRREAPHNAAAPHRYAVLICGRNEAAVIGDLIASLHNQTYDTALLHIFVLADNCTDDTALIARAAGATVYERQSTTRVGKGYALQDLLVHIAQDYPQGFDGYFVFDADNILAPDYIERMNETFSQGHQIITSYRNSKNYGDNWISAGYALWFLRESRYLNHARFLLGTSCAVSGTGFLFSRAVLEDMGPWPFHMLTEDIEFSVDQITKGRKIAFCPQAELYDEQPTQFRQSWRQRSRWSKGYLQVFRGYGKSLIRGIFRGSWSCFDMSMAIMPAFILSALGVVCNITLSIWGAATGDNALYALQSIGEMLCNMYLTLFIIGAVTTITEWRHIHTSTAKKLLYTLTFPLFMFTYLPIAISSLFIKPQWKPIEHRLSAAQLRKREAKEVIPL